MSSKNSSCSICRCLSSLMSFALTAVMLYIAWYFLGQPNVDEALQGAKDLGNKAKDFDWGDLTGALENFTGFSPELWDEDPFVGDNTTNLWKGHTSGTGGLYLELYNALDESWQTEYSEAVSDWNNWCPTKVLVLTSKDVDVDNKCDEVDGVMKVCNGNYGETGWLGINLIVKESLSQIILRSVAKMNEHYLLNADYDERLYTMCHELGHGYGLPHTDENFNNKDQGNCLDYTNTPANNLRPGNANCNRLLEMYGSVDGQIVGQNDVNRSRRRISQRQAQRSLRYSSDAELYEDFIGDDDEDESDDAQYFYEYARSQYPNMTAEYEEALHEMYYDLAQGNKGSTLPREDDSGVGIDERDDRGRGRWRKLNEHSRGGAFLRRLNAGFELEVHVLYPKDLNIAQ